MTNRQHMFKKETSLGQQKSYSQSHGSPMYVRSHVCEFPGVSQTIKNAEEKGATEDEMAAWQH